MKNETNEFVSKSLQECSHILEEAAEYIISCVAEYDTSSLATTNEITAIFPENFLAEIFTGVGMSIIFPILRLYASLESDIVKLAGETSIIVEVESYDLTKSSITLRFSSNETQD